MEENSSQQDLFDPWDLIDFKHIYINEGVYEPQWLEDYYEEYVKEERAKGQVHLFSDDDKRTRKTSFALQKT